LRAALSHVRRAAVPSVTVTAPLEMVGAIEHFVEAGVIGGKRSRHVNEWVFITSPARCCRERPPPCARRASGWSRCESRS
jgi:hypothetical protein